MKIARIASNKPANSYIVIGDRHTVITRGEIIEQAGINLPIEPLHILSSGLVYKLESLLPELKFTQLLNNVDLSFPIRDPPKIIFLNFNYKDQSGWIRFGRKLPHEPVFYLKPRTCLNGPFDNIYCPRFVTQLDFEGELAFVICKKCKNISEVNSMSVIGGYFVMNDISARDIQNTDIQVSRSKSFDTFAPCGPWITTRSEIPDPNNLIIKTKVNGEIRQDSNTTNMVLRIEEIVAKLSKVMTLEPGDIVSTGTPMGTILSSGGKKPWLRSGDVIEVEIERIGAIRNRVVFE